MQVVLEKIERIFEKAQSDNYIAGIPEDRINLYKSLLFNEYEYVKQLYEKTQSPEVSTFAMTVIPVVRKLAKDSFIDRIVPVQPIKNRVAEVRYIDYVYSTDDARSGAQKGKSILDNPPTTEYSRDEGEGEPITRGIDLKVRSIGVQARARKLIGSWTFEAEMSAEESGFDIREELTKALSYKITEEINYEVLYDLYAQAGIVHPDTWKAPQPTDSPREVERKLKDLYRYILDVAYEIYNEVGVYPTYIVVSPKVASYLKQIGAFEVRGKLNEQTVSRLYYEASFEEEFNVIVVRGLQTNDILVGYKGSSELEGGYIYAPYRPLIVAGDKFEPETLSWIRAIATYYAKVMVNPKLYGVVKVSV